MPKAAQAQGESDERARGLVSQRSYYGRLGSNKVANRLVSANQIGRKQQQQRSSTAAATSVSASSDAAVDVDVAGNRFYLIFDFLFFFSRGVTPAWAYLANKQPDAHGGRGRVSDAGRDSAVTGSVRRHILSGCIYEKRLRPPARARCQLEGISADRSRSQSTASAQFVESVEQPQSVTKPT